MKTQMIHNRGICDSCYQMCDLIGHIHEDHTFFIHTIINPIQTFRMILKNKREKNPYAKDFNYIKWLAFFWGYLGTKAYILTLFLGCFNLITFQEEKDWQYIWITNLIPKK